MPTTDTPAALAKSRPAVTTTTTLARALASALGLPDASRVGVAALLVAAEEVGRNSSFAARVRSAYDLLPAGKPTRGSSRGKAAAATILSSTLTPVRYVEGREINLAAPLDPYFLLEVYGADQLRQALDLFPLAKLKEGAEAVMARSPGAKPRSRSSKAAVVDFIVEQLAPTR
ncbi:MAG TPA: hypothetical protein VHI51_04575 [Ktedonobacterales bacterium]|jgi:hypothetical protein|nr:hypothetical protein [Ktedonobacterales bacterium]